MFKIISSAVIVALLISCGTPKHENIAAPDSTTVDVGVASAQNILSVEEQKDGWRLLFDGRTMNGWRVYRNMENDSWEVVDGTLHCVAFKEDGINKRSDLVTSEQFENFELRFDWKISPQGNSGVMFRVTEEFDEPYKTGPEYQILDDLGTPGDLEKVQLTGSNYHMHYPAAEAEVNPVGEWNESRIVANKNHVEHWLNGKKVVEYDILSDDWKQKIKGSKWKDFPSYGLASKGHIDLQDHKNEAWFRNIKIKLL